MKTDVHAVDDKRAARRKLDLLELCRGLEQGLAKVRPEIRDPSRSASERAALVDYARGLVAALHYGKVMDDAERDRINAELQADLAIEPPSQGQIQFE